MYILKAFCTFPSISNNTPQAVAPIGEISSNSLTYAKEVGTYQNTLHTNTVLKTFRSSQDGLFIEVPPIFLAPTLEICQWLYDEAVLGTLTGDHIEVAQRLTVEFGDLVDDVLVGQLMQGTSSTFKMPQWISYTVRNSSGLDNYVRIWFTNAAFSTQFDEYEIDIVPPLADLNQLFNPYNVVQGLLSQRTQTELFNQIQLKRGLYPETILRNDTYDWIDRQNSSFRIPTHWSALIYGIAGNNVDAVREATIEYLLENSDHTRDEWKEILPDLFISTEFVITPYWDKYSIDNLTVTTGLYSPVSFMDEPLEYALRTNTNYTTNHIKSCLCSTAAAYKSIGFAVVGGNENRDGVSRFDIKFPDYILVHTSMPDFNRMSMITRNWVFGFLEMLMIAESMTPWSDIPNIEYTRLVRENVMYLAWTYKSTTYLVASKYGFDDLTPNPIN